jgi:hypothetical protein
VTETASYPTDEDASVAPVEDVDPDPEVEDAPSDPRDPPVDLGKSLNPA